MSVVAYHPVTKAQVVVTEDQLAHMRASGWMLLSEHQENQAAAEAASAPAKSAKSTEKGM